MHTEQRRFYTRQFTPWTWHAKHLTWTLLTGGLWGVVWWWAYRLRRRPLTETYEAPTDRRFVL